MKSLVAAILAVLLLGSACARVGEPKGDSHASPPERTLVGQLLLPAGAGSRGVELRATIATPGQAPRTVWVLFDAEGRFAHTLTGDVIGIDITAAAEVHRIGPDNLPEVDRDGGIDVAVIDLRDRLVAHRLKVRAADGQPPGEVRVGMFSGPPPVGPYGEPVSLGSRQFPPVVLGSEIDWLLPSEAHAIYFLVERPSGPGRGTEWRSGRQRLFGPFTSADLPAELIVH